MFIILDNAESILDPKETGSREIYSVVDELCQIPTICLCITSRITTVPPRCKRPEIPTLSMEAACDIFYSFYGGDKRTSIINDLLERLDYHALSIKLLATAASHNVWDHDRLAKEWDAQRAQVLRTDYNESLAATIELSLSSPTFRSLGPDARDLLGVIAFFPQGLHENNLDWLLPTISNEKNTFDKFCSLSLTYRSNGFITMLAPIRDYLGPQDPRSSPLLCTTRDCYLKRLSVDLSPENPGFEEARWIVLEDVNVEYLLDVFVSFDQTEGHIWDACLDFVKHLVWHKPRQTLLRSRIEALGDHHPSKPGCLFWLSALFQQIGNQVERKKLLTLTLELERQRRDEVQIARTLRELSDSNRLLHLSEEGIRQVKEALEVFERINNTAGQAQCSNDLAWLLFDDKQLDAAEDAASRGINLVQGNDEERTACGLHRVLGYVHRSRGEKEKAIHHIQMALRIATPFNWRDSLFWNHLVLAELFHDEDELDEANTHIKRAKSHATDNTYWRGRAMKLQARIWYRQGRFEEAKLEALGALEAYEKLGDAKQVKLCRDLVQMIG